MQNIRATPMTQETSILSRSLTYRVFRKSVAMAPSNSDKALMAERSQPARSRHHQWNKDTLLVYCELLWWLFMRDHKIKSMYNIYIYVAIYIYERERYAYGSIWLNMFYWSLVLRERTHQYGILKKNEQKLSCSGWLRNPAPVCIL